MARDLSVDAEPYHEDMEHIDSDTMDTVLAMAEGLDPNSFTAREVRRTLSSDRVDPEGFASLLSPAAESMIEEMARKAQGERRRFFGNSVCLFTPLYISNYCSNGCVYCGFNSKNDIKRAKLELDQVEKELRAISATGLEEILMLTGESRVKSDVDYICDSVALAAKYFTNVGIEVYPMNSDEYRRIQEAGADYVTVFQETYDPKRYAELHPYGNKRIFSYRFDAQERALMGGMRGVAFGALLGIGDFRNDALRCGLHAYTLQRRYPHAEISMSLPRLRPFIHNEDATVPVTETQLLQVSLAYRLFLPFAGQTISTRECPRFRDGIVGISATKMSAGVSVGIGEHSGDTKGDGQFMISDPRSLDEILGSLRSNGMQPVLNDYVRTT
ncbi:thiazole biosynthesis protein ThiH [methanogenic archaeon mixed culture ISO4-G1]|nr:thiazole biosynthesis protein ThiH [methanogenic archaeon mixed culture ISO4-G1]